VRACIPTRGVVDSTRRVAGRARRGVTMRSSCVDMVWAICVDMVRGICVDMVRSSCVDIVMFGLVVVMCARWLSDVNQGGKWRPTLSALYKSEVLNGVMLE
jgi:hypothetical protein